MASSVWWGLITVVGWLVTATWALSLQRRNSRENHRHSLSRDVIDESMDALISLNEFKKACDRLVVNAGLADKRRTRDGYDFAGMYQSMIDRFSELSRSMHRIKMWIAISGTHLPDASKIIDANRYYDEAFDDVSGTRGDDSDWFKFMKVVIRYLNREASFDDLLERWEPLMKTVRVISIGITDGASEMNSALMPEIR